MNGHVFARISHLGSTAAAQLLEYGNAPQTVQDCRGVRQ